MTCFFRVILASPGAAIWLAAEDILDRFLNGHGVVCPFLTHCRHQAAILCSTLASIRFCIMECRLELAFYIEI